MQYRMPPPPVLTPFNLDSLGLSAGGLVVYLGASVSVAWPVNNLALFYPFRLFDFATAYQLLLMIGGTSGGNIDVGIYDSQKNLIVSSGSTAMSATVNTAQELNITDTPLPPGDYLLGVACSSTSGTVFTNSQADESHLSSYPIYEQASAFPLPNPCVPVVSTQGTVPFVVCGIQFRPTF